MDDNKPIRIMIKDGLIACCSQMCTDECPNYNTCVVINTTTRMFLHIFLNSYYGKTGGDIAHSIDRLTQLNTDIK